MKYHYVNVEVHLSGACVTAGGMLTLDECCELMRILNHFNACDFLIYKCEENV